MSSPRLIQTYLLDGTLEGVSIIEAESTVKAFVVPRIKLNDLKDRVEIKQPALYLLINSGDNQVYIGESENFFDRIKNHDQKKDFWDTAIAIVSTTNTLVKSDVKYLESLAIEKAKATAAMQVLNKTAPARNNIHEFNIHTLDKVLEDTALIAELLGFSVFSTKQSQPADIWYCKSKKTNAKAEFRGGKFIVLAGSVIDKTYADSWYRHSPEENVERLKYFEKLGEDKNETVLIKENIPFKNPNHAGRIVNGRSVNAWTTWKNGEGKTMDEVMRKGAA